MAKKRTTKAQKLRKFLGTPKTHKQIVQFLLRGTGNRYNETTRKYYDPMLYGTPAGTGFLYQECYQYSDRRYAYAY